LWREEEVEDTSDGAGHDSEEEEPEQEKEEEHEEGGGHYEGEVRHYEDEVVEGDRSASGSASSCQYRTSHLICPPVAPHEDNRVIIVPSSDT
jgi:hypothetical protein